MHPHACRYLKSIQIYLDPPPRGHIFCLHPAENTVEPPEKLPRSFPPSPARICVGLASLSRASPNDVCQDTTRNQLSTLAASGDGRPGTRHGREEGTGGRLETQYPCGKGGGLRFCAAVCRRLRSSSGNSAADGHWRRAEDREAEEAPRRSLRCRFSCAACVAGPLRFRAGGEGDDLSKNTRRAASRFLAS